MPPPTAPQRPFNGNADVPEQFERLFAKDELASALKDCWSLLEREIVDQTRAFCGNGAGSMLHVRRGGAGFDIELAYTKQKFVGPFDDAFGREMICRGHAHASAGGDEDTYINGLIQNYQLRRDLLAAKLTEDRERLSRMTEALQTLSTIDIRAFAKGSAQFRQEEERRLRADLSSMLAAINRSNLRAEFLPDGTIIDANENFLTAMGYTREQLVGGHP